VLHQAFFPQGRNPHGKQLVVQFDNCSVHSSVTTESFMKTRTTVSMPGPSYSPDLAPSHFLLFPTIKQRLEHAGHNKNLGSVRRSIQKPDWDNHNHSNRHVHTKRSRLGKQFPKSSYHPAIIQ
jgi:hypothetical protein